MEYKHYNGVYLYSESTGLLDSAYLKILAGWMYSQHRNIGDRIITTKHWQKERDDTHPS